MNRNFKAILNAEYGGIHATYWMFYGVSNSFASAYLLYEGYSNSEIGFILAVANVLAVFLQPYLADFADRSKKISLIGVSQLTVVFLICLEGCLFIAKGKSIVLWLSFVLIMAWSTALHPLLNSLSFKLEETDVHINYGACRSGGSLAYAVLCAFLGRLVEDRGAWILPISGEIVLGLMIIILILNKMSYGKALLKKSVINSDMEKNDQETIRTVHEEITLTDFIKRNKLFVAMNGAIVCVYFSNSILNSFMLQVVNNVGGSSEDMGRVFSVMAFLEIPALFFFDKIKEKVSCRNILKIAAVSFTIKIGLIYVANSMTLIYVAHFFQTFSFGLFIPAIVVFTDEVMRKGEDVRGQSLYTIATTTATIMASAFGGVLLDTCGAKIMLLVSTIITGLGALGVVMLIDRIKSN